MKVREKDVEYVAELANFELTQQERAGMLRDLNSILDYIDVLNELDTSNVPAMAQVSTHMSSDGLADQIGREDVPEGLRPSLTQELALRNAADSDGTFFLVPKVIER